jgi:hypothetical protein
MAWFSIAYLRMVGVFSSKAYADAVDIGESLMESESRVPAEWFVENRWVPKRVPDISFLKPIPLLLEDSRRRLNASARQNIDLETIRSKPQLARIAELIDRLDEVRGGKATFPGTLNFEWDPIYALLVQEGSAAVDALRNTYENDQRLTLTFDYSRPWSVAYTPISVREVARRILADIW